MNRDTSIKIRVTGDEYIAIKQRAESADMNISKFIRTLAFNGKIILYDTENIDIPNKACQKRENVV